MVAEAQWHETDLGNISDLVFNSLKCKATERGFSRPASGRGMIRTTPLRALSFLALNQLQTPVNKTVFAASPDDAGCSARDGAENSGNVLERERRQGEGQRGLRSRPCFVNLQAAGGRPGLRGSSAERGPSVLPHRVAERTWRTRYPQPPPKTAALWAPSTPCSRRNPLIVSPWDLHDAHVDVAGNQN